MHRKPWRRSLPCYACVSKKTVSDPRMVDIEMLRWRKLLDPRKIKIKIVRMESDTTHMY